MSRTQTERENIALHNLARNDEMSFGQLRAARVNGEAIDALAAGGSVHVRTTVAGERYRITTFGREELRERLATTGTPTIGGAL
jgi:hypothetical protein